MYKCLILFFLIMSTPLFAQERGNANYGKSFQQQRVEIPHVAFSNTKESVLEVRVLMNVKADAYIAVFSLVQMGENIGEVNLLMHERIQHIETNLKEMGINGSDFHVDMVSLIPLYEYAVEKKIFSKRTYNEVPKGFELQKNLHIRYQKPKDLSAIIGICAAKEVYDLVKVDYVVRNKQAYLDTIQQKAMNWIGKKEKMHKDLGLDLTSKKRFVVESQFSTYPSERYTTYTAFSSSSLEGVKRNAVITNVPKKQTAYYQPIVDKGYHIVLHPEIVEPIVQYSYTLKVKYVLEEEEANDQKEIQKEVYFLNSNGHLQRLNLD